MDRKETQNDSSNNNNNKKRHFDWITLSIISAMCTRSDIKRILFVAGISAKLVRLFGVYGNAMFHGCFSQTHKLDKFIEWKWKNGKTDKGAGESRELTFTYSLSSNCHWVSFYWLNSTELEVGRLPHRPDKFANVPFPLWVCCCIQSIWSVVVHSYFRHSLLWHSSSSPLVCFLSALRCPRLSGLSFSLRFALDSEYLIE